MKKNKQRYLVYGYYTDEPQVMCDVVDATSREDAEKQIELVRGVPSSGYTCDGALLLSEEIRGLQKIAKLTKRQITRDLKYLASMYAEEE